MRTLLLTLACAALLPASAHAWWLTPIVWAQAPGAESAPVEPAALPVEPVLERVRAAYEGSTALSARFDQEFHSGMGQPQRHAGQVVLAEGGRMRWSYAVPDERQFVSDGSQLWIWLPADNQVQVYSDLAGTPITRLYSFVAGLADLGEEFSLERGADADGEAVLQLQPRQEGWGLRDIEVRVALDSGHVVSVGYVDDFGGRTQIRFSQMAVGVEAPAAGFTFEAPEGADVARF